MRKGIETYIERQRRYYQENKTQRLVNCKKWRAENFEKALYMSARARARRKQIPFDLELSDIVIPDYCPYMKIPLTRTQGAGIVYSNASLDRIDSTKGYIKGNIRVISFLANQMKSHATEKELIRFADGILELHT